MSDGERSNKCLVEKGESGPSQVAGRKSSSTSSTEESSEEITLKLQPIVYKGTTLKIKAKPNQINIRNVFMRIITQIYGPKLREIQSVINEEFKEVKGKDVKTLLENIEHFNRAAKTYYKLWDGSNNSELGDWALPYCTQTPAIQITNLAYECAVACPTDLNNHYKSFSSETYGETNLEQMASILSELDLGPNDVFVDLGSGVGHLVCFTAALTKVKKAVGIELSSLPASHAKNMELYFKNLMSHFGKSYSPFELHKGDFLDKEFRDLITKEATVIFVNNYAFLPELTVKIVNELLVEMDEGVRIVSTKEFGVIKREINERNIGDVASMLDMRQMNSVNDAVSWTANAVNFWLHRVDRTKVENYYFQRFEKKNGKDKSSSREGSHPVDKDVKRKEKEGSSDSNSSSSSSLLSSKMSKTLKNKARESIKRPYKEKEGMLAKSVKEEAAENYGATFFNTSSSTVANRAKSEVKEECDEEPVFYGRTTRQMWKAQVGMTETKKIEPLNSPKYNEKEVEKDYAPATKKIKKALVEKKKKVAATPKIAKQLVSQPIVPDSPMSSPPPMMASRPMHSASKAATQHAVEKIDAETMSVINVLHEQTVECTQLNHSAADELARGELVSIQYQRNQHQNQPPPPQQVHQIHQQQHIQQEQQHTQQQQQQQQQPQQQQIYLNPIPVGSLSGNRSITPQPPQPMIAPVQNPQTLQQPQVMALSIPCQTAHMVPTQQLSVTDGQVITAEQMTLNPELANDNRHTFMLPPTDPLYKFTVSMYLDVKALLAKAQQNDPDLKLGILQDIEIEKAKNSELQEETNAALAQIDEYLSRGVKNLKERLQELDMSAVQEVSELLQGSKNIVAQHKSFTQRLTNMEVLVTQEEQKIREHGRIGEKGIEYIDQLMSADDYDASKVEKQIATWRAAEVNNYDIGDSNIISPNGSHSVARRNRQRQRTGTNNRRPGNGRQEDNEEVEREIQQFVQQALKMESLVKDKERRQRGSATTATEKTSRKVSYFMDEKSAAKQRSKLKRNGLGGAENTPSSQIDQTANVESSPMDIPGPSSVSRAVKRKSERETKEESSRINPHKKEMPKGKDLVDRIWMEIDNQQREHREKQAMKKAAADLMKASSSSESKTAPKIVLDLTSANLKILEDNNTLLEDFVVRKSMVDRLLGYKMYLGRMESCTTLGYKKMRQPKNSAELTEAQNEGAFIPMPFPFPEHCPSRLLPKPPRFPPRTPPFTWPEVKEEEQPVAQKKGPKTPPGSPGPSTPPPPPLPSAGQDAEGTDRQRLLVHMAHATGTTPQQVELFLGADLSKAIVNFGNKAELLESLKSALQSLGSGATVGSVSANPTPTKNSAAPQLPPPPVCRISSRLSDQMELVSDASLSDCGNKSKTPVLLSAPPIPPPLVAPPPPLPPIPRFTPMMQPPPPSGLPIALPSMTMPPPMSMPVQINHSMAQPPPPLLPPPPMLPQPPPAIGMPNYPYPSQVTNLAAPPQHNQPPPPLMRPLQPPIPPPSIPIQMLNVPPPPIVGHPPPPPPVQAPPPPPSAQLGFAMNVPPPPIATTNQTPIKKPVVELKSIMDVDVEEMKHQMSMAAKAVANQQNSNNSWRTSSAAKDNNTNRKTNNGSVHLPGPSTSASTTAPPNSSSGTVSHNVQFTLFSALGIGAQRSSSAVAPSVAAPAALPVVTPISEQRVANSNMNSNNRPYQNYNNNNRNNNFRRGGFRGGYNKYQKKKY